jgi:hypothetical protein
LLTPYFEGISQIAHPLTAPGFFKVCHAVGRFGRDGAAADVAVTGVVNQEVELGPILCGFANIADIHEGTQIRELRFDRRREEAFVHADISYAGFDGFFVGAVGDFLVVHTPGMTGLILVGIVTDRVTLERIRFQRQAAIEFVEP